mgnify:CR=1 FL=1
MTTMTDSITFEMHLRKPSQAIAGTFNPELLAGSMARLLLNLGDEISMLGFEMMCKNEIFTDDIDPELAANKITRWDRRLQDLQDRFDLLTAEPVDCYLDAVYPEGMESEQMQLWLEKCTDQLDWYWGSTLNITMMDQPKSLDWRSWTRANSTFLTNGEVNNLYFGNYQLSDSEIGR